MKGWDIHTINNCSQPTSTLFKNEFGNVLLQGKYQSTPTMVKYVYATEERCTQRKLLYLENHTEYVGKIVYINKQTQIDHRLHLLYYSKHHH